MLDWLDEMAGPGYSQAVLWTLLALLVLVVLLVVLKLVSSLRYGTFVAGGRNRKARLAVSDATAVDGHRRLVLVRRDDVEHLLLIGGSSDIVVEQDIRIGQPRRVPAPAEREAPPPAAPAPAPAVAAPPPPAVRSRAAEPSRPQAPVMKPAPERVQPPSARAPEMRVAASLRPAPARGQPVRHDASRTETGAETRPPAAAPTPPLPADDLDSALLKELEVSLDGDERSNGTAKPSLDDEMARLLGELSNPRR
jgi:hypothetical protein